MTTVNDVLPNSSLWGTGEPLEIQDTIVLAYRVDGRTQLGLAPKTLDLDQSRVPGKRRR